MSGGSYDYVERHIREFADNLRPSTPERKAFKVLLYKVADAAHAVEWVDSCDWGTGDETPHIMKCLSRQDVLAEAMVDAEKAKAELERVLAAASVALESV